MLKSVCSIPSVVGNISDSLCACPTLANSCLLCSDLCVYALQQVQCYICKQTGHLCCVEVVDASPTPVSCYQCGDLGHSGVVSISQIVNEDFFLLLRVLLTELRRESSWMFQGCNRQNGDRGDRSSCYKCGQEGHFARECPQTNRDYNIKQVRVYGPEYSGPLVYTWVSCS